MRVVTIHDYNTNKSARELADMLMDQFGYDPNTVDEIEMDDVSVSFRTIESATTKRAWTHHDR